jgi:hypothetical protein
MVLRWIAAPPAIGPDTVLPPAPPLRRLKLLHVITAF